MRTKRLYFFVLLFLAFAGMRRADTGGLADPRLGPVGRIVAP